MTDIEGVQDIIQGTGGQVEYKHTNGEISTVSVNMAGMGTRKIRIAKLPPEVAENTFRASLAHYGKILSVKKETWARTYRYAVANVIGQVEMTVTKHIPSHMTIAGHRVLTSYDSQPLTCYVFGAIGHLYHACPNKRGRNKDLNTRIGLTQPLRRMAHHRRRRARKTGQTEKKPRNRRI